MAERRWEIGQLLLEDTPGRINAAHYHERLFGKENRYSAITPEELAALKADYVAPVVVRRKTPATIELLDDEPEDEGVPEVPDDDTEELELVEPDDDPDDTEELAAGEAEGTLEGLLSG